MYQKQEVKFKYENLVLGSSFDAVLFAFKEGYPILYKDLQSPFAKEEIQGKNKKDIYDMMLFLLSISNLNPFGGKVAEIRQENGKIFVSGHKPWIFEIEAATIHDFTKEKRKLHKVVDLFKIKNPGIHPFTGYSSKNKFVNQINLLVGKHYSESIEVISYLTDKQLNKEEYSYMYSMIKAKQILKDAGMKRP